MVSFQSNRRTDNSDAERNTPETSSEMLDDVLKQLDKLGPEKRKKVLDRLTAANLIDTTQTQTEQSNASIKVVYGEKSAKIAQDKVEILDLHSPEMEKKQLRTCKHYFDDLMKES